MLENIRKIGRLKNEYQSDYPQLSANLTLINSNISELPGFVDLAHDLGIQHITGRHLILCEGLDIDHEIIRDEVMANSLIETARKKAAGYGITFAVPGYSSRTAPKSCRAPWDRLYISSNGDVSVCPRIHVYEGTGNLIREDCEDVMDSTQLADLRNQFMTGNYKNPVCGICNENREEKIAIDQGF